MSTADTSLIKGRQTVEKKEVDPALVLAKEQILKGATKVLPEDLHHVKRDIDALAKAYLSNNHEKGKDIFVALAPIGKREVYGQLWETLVPKDNLERLRMAETPAQLLEATKKAWPTLKTQEQQTQYAKAAWKRGQELGIDTATLVNILHQAGFTNDIIHKAASDLGLDVSKILQDLSQANVDTTQRYDRNKEIRDTQKEAAESTTSAYLESIPVRQSPEEEAEENRGKRTGKKKQPFA